MVRTTTVFFAVLATASTVYAQASCSLGSPCPEDAPCCDEYGQCGVGAYCLGGCDPRMSYKLESCVPEPVCQSKTYTFTSLDRITPMTEYLGDASTTDWVSDGNALIYENNLLLTMAPDTVGTVISTASYMWYGNVKATLKTSRDAGVVTAFILFSDVRDEIDYEFVGTELTTAQTNYYWQGVPDYDNSANISLSNTYENYHTYEIDWTPDTITWMVDGQVGRVKQRADTYNATLNGWDFPQTPARVQLSLWPGGLASNAPGTIAWAGGEINWDSPDIQANGYYYAMIESVTVSCYNATSAPGTNTGVSYTYSSAVGTNNTVIDGDEPTVLKSLLGTGTNLTAGASASETAATVPGLSGTGPDPGDSDGSGSSTSSGSAASSAATSTCTSGFCQGSGSSGTKSGAEMLNANERVLRGSIFAFIVVVVAMMAL